MRHNENTTCIIQLQLRSTSQRPSRNGSGPASAPVLMPSTGARSSRGEPSLGLARMFQSCSRHWAGGQPDAPGLCAEGQQRRANAAPIRLCSEPVFYSPDSPASPPQRRCLPGSWRLPRPWGCRSRGSRPPRPTCASPGSSISASVPSPAAQPPGSPPSAQLPRGVCRATPWPARSDPGALRPPSCPRTPDAGLCGGVSPTHPAPGWHFHPGAWKLLGSGCTQGARPASDGAFKGSVR